MVRRRREEEALEERHEINVTPFIDVMLVLLIVFMVAAPLATVDVHVDLPGSNATPGKRPDKPLYLTLKADGTLVLGDASVTGADLAVALDRESGGDHETRIFVRADKSLPYGKVMTAMNLLRAAGYLKVALVGLEEAAPAGALAPGAPQP